MGRPLGHVEGAEAVPMSVQSQAEKAAMIIEQSFRDSITAIATDTCETCARTINGTGFENIAAEQVNRLRLAVELAGYDQARIFCDTHKVFDFPHIFWAYFSLFQAAAATLIEVAYDRLAKIERAQPELSDGWALGRCMEQCKQVSKAITLWTQNATHPYAGTPWLAPSYLLELPSNGVWGNSNSSWLPLDESGTDIVVGILRNTFCLRLLIAAQNRYERGLVAAAQEVPPSTESNKAALLTDEKKRTTPSKRSAKQRREDKRHETIRDIIKSGAVGIDYCKMMDDRKVPPLFEWIGQGWPGTYVAAYNSRNPADRKKWQKKIQTDKSRNR
jgi:hypothetical protein